MVELFIGCDVSKGYGDFIVLDCNKKVLERGFRLYDTHKGHDKLCVLLETLVKSSTDPIAVYIGVESTGGYENNWLQVLALLGKSLPVKSARINPCGVKKYMDAELKRNKTDAISAQGIAEYLIMHRDKVLYDQNDPYYALRRYWSGLTLLKKQYAQLQTHLQQLIYSTVPSVLVYCRHGIPSWLLNVLDVYPTGALLAKATVKKLCRIPFVTETKAKALIEAAKQRTMQETNLVEEQHLRSMLTQIKSLASSIQAIEKSLEQQWKDDPQIKLVDSITGIGFISALGLLINIRNIKLYPTVKHLASYFGIHPVIRQSGDGIWKSKMSKVGRVQPRAILYMAACTATIHNPCIRDVYKHYKQRHRDKNNLGAIGACMHKLLRIIYGVLKNQQPFNAEVDRKNQEKKRKEAKVTNAFEGKMFRFQGFDNEAPISNRHATKKNKADRSQSADSTENGITTCSACKENTIIRNENKELICTT